jgi:hypothetical protein
VGTYLGIILHSAPATSTSSSTTSSSLHSLTQAIHSTSTGLFGTTVTLSECVIPFTAGTFIYIATVGVVPGLLKDTKSAGGGLQAVREILAMTVSSFLGLSCSLCALELGQGLTEYNDDMQ